jgi:hypothetical protein
VNDIQTSSQAAEALRPIAGVFTFALFAAGIIATGMLAVPEGLSLTQRRVRQVSWQRIGGASPVAAGKAADLGGERPLPSIARFRTASISDARGGNEPRFARM